MAAKRPRVLIADDEPLFRQAVADALRAQDPTCFVTEVSDGLEAEIALLGAPYSCVITDLQMPLVDGYCLLDVMRDRAIDVPIVVVSAHGTETTKTRVGQLGAARYFDKPVELPALVDTVLALAAEPTQLVAGQEVLAGQVLRVLESEWPRQRAARATVRPPARSEPLGAVAAASSPTPAAAPRPPSAPLLPPPSSSPSRDGLSPTRGGSTSLAQQFERTIVMNIEQALQSAMEISGCIGVTLVDFESGMSLGSKGNSTINLEVAAAGNTEVIRAKLRTMQALGLDDKIEDILITLSTQYHILRPLRRLPNLFLYLALDRSKANLALARMKATTIEQELRV